METDIITKVCSNCGKEYKAPRYEVEYLMYLKLCPICLEKHENKKDEEDDYWSSSLNGSSAIGGVV